MTRLMTLGVLATVVAVSPARGADALRLQSERVFDGRGLQEVRVETTRGLVVVSPSSDGKVHLTAIKESRGQSREQAERMADETRVTAEQRGGTLEVRVDYPRHSRTTINLWRLLTGDFEVPRFQVKLALEVPPATALDIRSSSADVRTRGIAGTQVIAATSGDVRVHDARSGIRISTSSGDIEAWDVGTARLGSASGDIEVSDVRGALTATTSSGDVDVRGAVDAMSVESTSGDIQARPVPRGAVIRTSSGTVVLRDAAGGLDVESSSGSVSIGLVDPLERVAVSTSSGDVRARYGSRSGCTLDLKTSSGTIDVKLPVEMRSASRRTLRGKVGDGAVAVRLQTASGDIRVAGPRN